MRLLAASGALLLGLSVYGDTITLRNGRVLEGTFQGGDSRVVRLVIGSRVETFYINEIESLRFGGLGAQSANYDGPPPPDGPPPMQAPQRPFPPADDNVGQAPMPPQDQPRDRRDQPRDRRDSNNGYQVAAGTNLSIRMIDAVDSDRDRVGQTFRASLDQPLYIDGQEAIPRGADVKVKLVDETQSGKFEGRASLTLDLVSIRVNDHEVFVNTSDVHESSGSRGERSTKVVGGTAALGAILGAIAGGGRGAAIGAASGGAVGAGAEAVTHGQRVRIPSETRLTFTLQQPLSL